VEFNPRTTPEWEFVTAGKVKLSSMRFRLRNNGGPNTCQLEAKHLLGRFPVEKTPQPLVVTFTKAKLNQLREGAGGECGTGGMHALSGTFTFTSEGQPIEVVK